MGGMGHGVFDLDKWHVLAREQRDIVLNKEDREVFLERLALSPNI